MSKHSPGPWKRGDSGWFYDANGKAIVYSDGEVVSCGPEDERLIAAAPDSHATNIVTIKALQLVYHFGEDADDQWIYDELGTELSSAYFMARAAIAKVTGEQP